MCEVWNHPGTPVKPLNFCKIKTLRFNWVLSESIAVILLWAYTWVLKAMFKIQFKPLVLCQKLKCRLLCFNGLVTFCCSRLWAWCNSVLKNKIKKQGNFVRVKFMNKITKWGESQPLSWYLIILKMKVVWMQQILFFNLTKRVFNSVFL